LLLSVAAKRSIDFETAASRRRPGGGKETTGALRSSEPHG